MRYIPWPKGRENSCRYVKSRYIADSYDGGSFLDWPNRNGVAHLIKGLLVPGSEVVCGAEVARHLQTWLLYGLLHEFLGAFGDVSNFSVDIDGEKYVSLERLPTAAMIQALEARVKGWEEKRAHRTKCLELLAEVVAGAAKLPDLDTVLPVIVIVAETLDPESVEFINNRRPGLERTSMWYAIILKTLNLNVPRLIQERLDAATLSIYLYFEQLVRTMRDDPPGKHRCAGECELVTIDQEKVQAILESGHIALLDSELNVVSSADFPRYTATSHVWSKGLGNEGNILPACQIKAAVSAVERAAAKHNTSKLFWLDTLCCPVNKYHRELCIMRMSQIYRQAESVLIIDHFGCREDYADIIEILAKLLLSSWTTRLWTFQEGFLARKLLLELADDVVDVDSLLDTSWESVQLSIGKFPIVFPLLQMVQQIRLVIHKGAVTGFRSLIACSTKREVTVATDEALCLSTSCDLDQSAVLGASDRMVAFWKGFAARHVIPRWVVLFYGERMQLKGFRWAPASLLRSTHFTLVQSTPKEAEAELTNQGLCFTWPGARIRGSISTTRELRCVSDGKWYTLIHTLGSDLGKLPFFPPDRTVLELVMIKDLAELSYPYTRNFCLAGTVTQEGSVNRFEPYASYCLNLMTDQEQVIEKFAWFCVQRVKEHVADRTEVYHMLERMSRSPEAELENLRFAGLTPEKFLERTKFLVDYPPVELEQVWSKDQQWCVG